MILMDSSVLYALIDEQQPKHTLCHQTLNQIRSPLITTLPCLTEAMYFAYKAGGGMLQRRLWEMLAEGFFSLYFQNEMEVSQMMALMETYHDRPMDFADASLMATAHTLNIRTVFTLDSDFYIYRFRDNGTFNVIP